MNKEATLTIDYIGRRGDGVGHLDGQPVFVPRALPGETVCVRLLAARDKGIAARLLSIEKSAPERIDPPCPYYEDCGGCALQHWDESAYRNWKFSRVRDQLSRAELSVGAWLDPVFIPHTTRRRTTLAALVQNKKLRLGYHRARSHDIIDIPDCIALSPRLDTLRSALRPHLKSLLSAEKAAAIFLQDTGLAVDMMITGAVGPRKTPEMAEREIMARMAQECNIARLSWRLRDKDEAEIIVQPAPVLKQSGSLRVELPPGAFLQPSAEGEKALIDSVRAPIKSAGARRVADLFAGCGTFSGPLRDDGVSVLAVEVDPAAIAAVKKTGLEARQRNLFSAPLIPKELNEFDAVIIDPPRMGAKEQALALASSSVPLVVSVSCNPGTFARDAALLCAGGYQLESVQVIDQFIWSAHIECVGAFRRRSLIQ